MANEKEIRTPGRNGTVTVYGSSQSVAVGGEDPVYDPARYVPREMDKDEIMRRYNLDEAGWSAAQRRGLPAGRVVRTARLGGWGFASTRELFRVEDVEACFADYALLAGK